MHLVMRHWYALQYEDAFVFLKGSYVGIFLRAFSGAISRYSFWGSFPVYYCLLYDTFDCLLVDFNVMCCDIFVCQGLKMLV